MIARFKDVPAGVWALGFVSMLMDISSEMIHALLPIYMVTVLGTSTLAVGLIEGIAEATAAITQDIHGGASQAQPMIRRLFARRFDRAAHTIQAGIGRLYSAMYCSASSSENE